MIWLEELGIYLRSETVGEHRCACPKCARVKERRNDEALAVRIESDRAVWYCHRCGWKGATCQGRSSWQRPRKFEHEVTTIELAREIWNSAHPLCSCRACEPGRTYLRSRGITEWPETIFLHPELPFEGRLLPTLLAPVTGPATHVTGIWRIILSPEGEKLSRRGLGPAKGCCAKLYPALGDELGVAEGVEDALATFQLTRKPCWAALSASFMPQVQVPASIQYVTIFSDADPAGRQGAEALQDRLRSEGRQARIRIPIQGKDPNDVLLAAQAPC